MDRWEYHTAMLWADADRADEFLAARFPGWRPSKHSPEALIPSLNSLGVDGWELVSIQPVYPGIHGDVAVLGSGAQLQWTAWYLCTFKRRLPETDTEPATATEGTDAIAGPSEDGPPEGAADAG